ncbi:hypothetical protein KQI65_07440 [bacterium]|nr:hypothetical protein [bacterium]
MIRIATVLCLLLYSIPLPGNISAQGMGAQYVNEKGAPFVTYHNTSDLGYDVSNWCAVRDDRGLLWVGNSFGLIEYDGMDWRILESPNETPVYSVAVGKNGTVYFGLRSAFGRVCFDRCGNSKMELLSDRLPDDAPLLTEVEAIHVIENTVYFVSREAVCVWDGENCYVQPSSAPIGGTFKTGNRLFGQIFGTGLCELRNSEWQLVPGGEIFAEQTTNDSRIEPSEKIICLFQDRGKLMVATRLRGLLQQDGNGFRQVHDYSAVEDPLWMPTCAIHLPDGALAVGSTHSGICIFKPNGSVRTHINSTAGFRGGSVTAMYIDAEDVIWAALENGLLHIEWPGEALSKFSSARGALGQITAVERFAGTMYAGSTQGMFALGKRSRSNVPSMFRLLPNVRSTVYDLQRAGDVLLIASFHGVYEMNASQQLRRISSTGARVLHTVHGSTDTLLAGHHHGLYFLVRDGNEWKTKDISNSLEDFVLSISEDKTGAFWVTTVQFGARRLRIKAGTLDVITDVYGEEKGLTPGPSFVSTIDGNPLVVTEMELMAYDRKNDHFYPDTTFVNSFFSPLTDDPKFLREDNTGTVWMQLFESQAFGYADLHNNEREFHSAPFRRITGDVIAVYTDIDGSSWFGTNDAVYRFIPGASTPVPPSYSTLIRELYVDGKSLYNGDCRTQSDSVFCLSSDAQHITISFVSGNITLENSMMYQWILEGYDSTWSAPAQWHSAEYTALPPGDYVFRVRALRDPDTQNHLSSIAFTIPQHWYLQWWVLLLFFGGIALFLIIAYFRLR